MSLRKSKNIMLQQINRLGYGGFEVLTAVVMKNAIFWDIVL
jgi:hypothetical protein